MCFWRQALATQPLNGTLLTAPVLNLVSRIYFVPHGHPGLAVQDLRHEWRYILGEIAVCPRVSNEPIRSSNPHLCFLLRFTLSRFIHSWVVPFDLPNSIHSTPRKHCWVGAIHHNNVSTPSTASLRF